MLHLGSTSLATCGSGNACGGNGAAIPNSRTWYKPYGEVRGGGSGSPTDFGFNGQRGEPSLGGLLDYHARYYDPLLARFISADTIVPSPSSPQALNRYSYVLNSPLKYVDPTGHFTEQAIFDYLLSSYGGSWHAASYRLEQWKNDSEWWAMMGAAKAGDTLFGGIMQTLSSQRASQEFQFEFRGEGENSLTGITPMIPLEYMAEENVTLVGIQANTKRWVGADGWDWVGVLGGNDDGVSPNIRYSRYSRYEHFVSEGEAKTVSFIEALITGGAMMLIPGGPTTGIGRFVAGAAKSVGGIALDKFILDGWLNDALDMQIGDVHMHMGPSYFNFQFVPAKGWVQENSTYCYWYDGD